MIARIGPRPGLCYVRRMAKNKEPDLRLCKLPDLRLLLARGMISKETYAAAAKRARGTK